MPDHDALIRDATDVIARADRLLKVSEAARRWDCSKRTIQRLIAAGKIPCVRVGFTQRQRLRESFVAQYEAIDDLIADVSRGTSDLRQTRQE